MKGQFSRDSFNPDKNYSGVYQQQGRMLTDADWNEMVRILKNRMDRTVGGAIKSGSPRYDGILAEDLEIVEGQDVLIGPELRWGRIYVDGVYAEVAPGDSDALGSVWHFISNQRDLKVDWSKIPVGRYILYVDVWEKLVLAQEDENLMDPALHGADTCVRTQTMAQLKLIEKPEEATWPEIKPPPHGNAKLTISGPSGNANESSNNFLFRLEVHAVETSQSEDGAHTTSLILKWSRENGSEYYANQPDSIPDAFWDPYHLYEYYTEEDDKRMGMGPYTPNPQTQPGRPLYPLEHTPPDGIPFVRRWDGMCTIKNGQLDTEKSLSGLDSIQQEGNLLILKLNNLEQIMSLELDKTFLAGDYWLALVRNNGMSDSVEPLSAKPAGVCHHYMDIGTVMVGDEGEELYWELFLTPDQTRRLSFPPLTKLTLDRVHYDPFNGDPVTIGETLVSHGKRLGEHDERLEKHDERFDEHDKRINAATSVTTIGKNGAYPTIEAAFEAQPQAQNLELFLLEGEHTIVDPSKLSPKRSLRIQGASDNTSYLNLPAGISLVADDIVIHDLGFESTTIGLAASRVTIERCKGRKQHYNTVFWRRPPGNISIANIALDGEGNVFVTGWFSGEVDFEGPGGRMIARAQDIFVLKLNPGGGTVWARQFEGIFYAEGKSIAVDVEGNVFVTGWFTGEVKFKGPEGPMTTQGVDIFVLKLNSKGNTVWARQFGGISNDYGNSVAVDVEGNVFVTGWFTGEVKFKGPEGTMTAQDVDIFVLKLNSKGNTVWARSFGGVSSDFGNSVDVDGEGNVFITGIFEGEVDFKGPEGPMTAQDGDSDIFVLKLNPGGGTVWVRQFDGMFSIATDSMAVDGEGNVLVTGYFRGEVDFKDSKGSKTAQGFDIFVLKLNSKGNTVWARQFGGVFDDAGNSVAVDGEGNVYATGYFEGDVDFEGPEGTMTAQGKDIMALKLNPTGVTIWARQLGGTGDDRGVCMAVDTNGNVFVSKFDCVYNIHPNDNVLQAPLISVATLNTPLVCAPRAFLEMYYPSDVSFDSVSVDTKGNVFVMGWFVGEVDFKGPEGPMTVQGGDSDIFVLKLNPGGGTVWARQFDGILSHTVTDNMAVDGEGNVFVTGYFRGEVDFKDSKGPKTAQGFDIFVLKLDPGGGTVWAEQFGGVFREAGNSVAVDGKGNVYVTGYFEGEVDFRDSKGPKTAQGRDIFVLKLDSSGGVEWARQFGGVSSERGNSVAVDGEGNVFVTGFFGGEVDFKGPEGPMTAHDYDIFVLKLDPGGGTVWAKQFGGVSTDYSYSVAVDGQGNVLVTGFFEGEVDFKGLEGPMIAQGSSDIFVLKLNPGGGTVWAKQLGDAGADGGVCVAIGKEHDIILAVRHGAGSGIYRLPAACEVNITGNTLHSGYLPGGAIRPALVLAGHHIGGVIADNDIRGSLVIGKGGINPGLDPQKMVAGLPLIVTNNRLDMIRVLSGLSRNRAVGPLVLSNNIIRDHPSIIAAETLTCNANHFTSVTDANDKALKVVAKSAAFTGNIAANPQAGIDCRCLEGRLAEAGNLVRILTPTYEDPVDTATPAEELSPELLAHLDSYLRDPAYKLQMTEEIRHGLCRLREMGLIAQVSGKSFEKMPDGELILSEWMIITPRGVEYLKSEHRKDGDG